MYETSQNVSPLVRQLMSLDRLGGYLLKHRHCERATRNGRSRGLNNDERLPVAALGPCSNLLQSPITFVGLGLRSSRLGFLPCELVGEE